MQSGGPALRLLPLSSKSSRVGGFPNAKSIRTRYDAIPIRRKNAVHDPISIGLQAQDRLTKLAVPTRRLLDQHSITNAIEFLYATYEKRVTDDRRSRPNEIVDSVRPQQFEFGSGLNDVSRTILIENENAILIGPQ